MIRGTGEIWVDFSYLPKRGKNIEWKKCRDCIIPFRYLEVEGEFKILQIINSNKLLVQYLENEPVEICINNLTRGNFRKVVFPNLLRNYYKVGDKIIDEKRHLEIVELIKLPNGNSTQNGYIYKCLDCGDINRCAHSLMDRQGCLTCENKKVRVGINDMATTHPHLALLCTYKKDSYKYTAGSHEKIYFTCPNCKHKRKIAIYHVRDKGVMCPKCRDGATFPTKAMTSILNQLDLDFEVEKVFDWFPNRRYDFYLEINNKSIIIEVHGGQHYNGGFKTFQNGRTIEEEKENDDIKEFAAIDNGIDYYIEIDCRYSTIEWFRNSLMNSVFSEIFKLDKIDWEQCREDTLSNLTRNICGFWNSGIKSSTKIGKLVKKDRSTVIRYLKEGAKLGWCDYYPYNHLSHKKPITCIENGLVFESITDCVERSNEIFGEQMTVTGISSVIRGVCKTHKGYSFREIGK